MNTYNTRKLSKSGRAPSRSRSHDPKLLYQRKGLVTRNTRAKYESSTSYNAKVMANVKVFADGKTDRQTDRVITIRHPPCGGALKSYRDSTGMSS